MKRPSYRNTGLIFWMNVDERDSSPLVVLNASPTDWYLTECTSVTACLHTQISTALVLNVREHFGERLERQFFLHRGSKKSVFRTCWTPVVSYKLNSESFCTGVFRAWEKTWTKMVKLLCSPASYLSIGQWCLAILLSCVNKKVITLNRRRKSQIVH